MCTWFDWTGRHWSLSIREISGHVRKPPASPHFGQSRHYECAGARRHRSKYTLDTRHTRARIAWLECEMARFLLFKVLFSKLISAAANKIWDDHATNTGEQIRVSAATGHTVNLFKERFVLFLETMHSIVAVQRKAWTDPLNAAFCFPRSLQ